MNIAPPPRYNTLLIVNCDLMKMANLLNMYLYVWKSLLFPPPQYVNKSDVYVHSILALKVIAIKWRANI